MSASLDTAGGQHNRMCCDNVRMQENTTPSEHRSTRKQLFTGGINCLGSSDLRSMFWRCHADFGTGSSVSIIQYMLPTDVVVCVLKVRQLAGGLGFWLWKLIRNITSCLFHRRHRLLTHTHRTHAHTRTNIHTHTHTHTNESSVCGFIDSLSKTSPYSSPAETTLLH